jgi:DNA-binding NtrC family response regulator
MRSLPSARVLIVAGSRKDGDRLREVLAKLGHQPTLAHNAAGALAHLDEESFDVVLLDPALPDGGSEDVQARVHSEDLPTRVLVLARTPAHEGRALVRDGAGWIAADGPEDELDLRVREAAREARNQRLVQRLAARLAAARPVASDFVAADPAMRQLVAAADRAAASELPVLIEGEAGVGKAALARRIHARSARASAPFVDADCRDRNEAELEAVLFGTGRAPGLAEAADGGVLLLRGVETLSAALQARLLRLIETRDLFRAGAARAIPADVRVISTCRGDLDAFVRSGRLQEGLFDRLDGLRFRLPPLRERLADVGALASHFLAVHGRGRLHLTPEALERLREMPWPGNVAELLIAIRWAAARAAGDRVDAPDLAVPAGSRGGLELAQGLPLRKVERAYIEAALQRNRGHRGRTARELGIDPKTLYNKLGAERPRKKAGAP